LKPNYLGIVGGILALVSLALPWWTMSISFSNGPYRSVDLSILYTASQNDVVARLEPNWYPEQYVFFGLLAIFIMVMGGATAIVSGVRPDMLKNFRRGTFILISIISFVIGLELILYRWIGWLNVFLFGSDEVIIIGEHVEFVSYSSYLSFGFWLALAAAIIIFVAFRKKPVRAAVAPQPSPPPAMSQQTQISKCFFSRQN